MGTVVSEERDLQDPVLERRARMAGLAVAGKRVGYGLVVLAVVAFAVGAATGFGAAVTAVVTASLLATTLTLAPAIVVGYAVKAAEREDAARARAGRPPAARASGGRSDGGAGAGRAPPAA